MAPKYIVSPLHLFTSIELYIITFDYTALLFVTFDYTAFFFVTFDYTALLFITFDYTRLHFVRLSWARPSGGRVLLPQVASDGPDRPQQNHPCKDLT